MHRASAASAGVLKVHCPANGSAVSRMMGEANGARLRLGRQSREAMRAEVSSSSVDFLESFFYFIIFGEYGQSTGFEFSEVEMHQIANFPELSDENEDPIRECLEEYLRPRPIDL